MSGKLVHFELPARDAERARSFWSGVFGWSFKDSGMPGIDYWMVQTGDDQGGAVFTSEDGTRGPIVYFDTDDIDASIGKIRELDGNAEDKSPIPGVGWMARCKDPEGTEFSLFQSDESAQMPE